MVKKLGLNLSTVLILRPGLQPCFSGVCDCPWPLLPTLLLAFILALEKSP